VEESDAGSVSGDSEELEVGSLNIVDGGVVLFCRGLVGGRLEVAYSGTRVDHDHNLHAGGVHRS
jgi:hypothetical protein